MDTRRLPNHYPHNEGQADKPRHSGGAPGYAFSPAAHISAGIGMVLPQWAADETGPLAGTEGESVAATPDWPSPPPPPSTHHNLWSTHVWLPAASRLLSQPESQPGRAAATAEGGSVTQWAKLSQDLVQEVRERKGRVHNLLNRVQTRLLTSLQTLLQSSRQSV